MYTFLGFFSGMVMIISLLLSVYFVKKYDHYKYEVYTKYAFSRLASHKSTRKYAILFFTITSLAQIIFILSLNQILNFNIVFYTLSFISIIFLPITAVTARKYNSFIHLFSAFLYFFSELFLLVILSIEFINNGFIIGFIGIGILTIGIIISGLVVLKKPYKISGKEEIVATTFLGICIFLYSLTILFIK